MNNFGNQEPSECEESRNDKQQPKIKLKGSNSGFFVFNDSDMKSMTEMSPKLAKGFKARSASVSNHDSCEIQKIQSSKAH